MSFTRFSCVICWSITFILATYIHQNAASSRLLLLSSSGDASANPNPNSNFISNDNNNNNDGNTHHAKQHTNAGDDNKMQSRENHHRDNWIESPEIIVDGPSPEKNILGDDFRFVFDSDEDGNRNRNRNQHKKHKHKDKNKSGHKYHVIDNKWLHISLPLAWVKFLQALFATMVVLNFIVFGFVLRSRRRNGLGINPLAMHAKGVGHGSGGGNGGGAYVQTQTASSDSEQVSLNAHANSVHDNDNSVNNNTDETENESNTEDNGFDHRGRRGRGRGRVHHEYYGDFIGNHFDDDHQNGNADANVDFNGDENNNGAHVHSPLFDENDIEDSDVEIDDVIVSNF